MSILGIPGEYDRAQIVLSTFLSTPEYIVVLVVSLSTTPWIKPERE
jgi:hypothetical protein